MRQRWMPFCVSDSTGQEQGHQKKQGNMQFVAWETHYQITKSQLKGKDLTLEEYLNSYLRFIEEEKRRGGFTGIITNDPHAEISMVLAESQWLRSGRPYYKFHPSLMEPARRLKLNGIATKLIDVPRDFPVVNIQFEKTSLVQSILAYKNETGVMLIVKLNRTINTLFLIFPTNIDMDIETFIESCPQSVRPADCELSRNVLRYYITVKFLADVPNEDLIEYDILNKYKNEWLCATTERKREIVEKSKKEGKIGWNLGVNELLIHNAPRLSEPKQSEEKRGELEYAHIRTGHLHAVRCGPQHQHVKIMFYRPTVVRKDLPFKVENI